MALTFVILHNNSVNVILLLFYIYIYIYFFFFFFFLGIKGSPYSCVFKAMCNAFHGV